MTCPFVQALALLLALVQHSAPANDHPEVVYHSQITSYECKLINRQRLGENISKLMLSGDKLHFDILLLNVISDEVMSDINVLCPCVLNWILGKADSACVVTEDGCLRELQAKIS